MLRSLVPLLPLLLIAGPAPTTRTLDVLTFIPPDGFAFDRKEGSDHATLTRIDGQVYCVIALYASRAAGESLEADFALEFPDILKSPAPKAKLRTVGSASAIEGAAAVTAGGNPAYADMIMIAAGQRVASIVVMVPAKSDLKAYRTAIDGMLATMVVKSEVAAAATPATNREPETPPSGTYGCLVISYSDVMTFSTTYSPSAMGSISLSKDGGYEWNTQGGGKWTFDAKTRRVRFTSGPLKDWVAALESSSYGISMRLRGSSPANPGDKLNMEDDVCYVK